MQEPPVPAKATRGAPIVPREVVGEYIRARSDVQGLAQLTFHVAVGFLCAHAVKTCTTW